MFIFAQMDVFSYGILVCEMSICEQPENSNGREGQIMNIHDDQIRNLVLLCTKIDPNERPTMLDVIGIWRAIGCHS